jgi:transglutaminase/protease-like cytokinesis protein 3
MFEAMCERIVQRMPEGLSAYDQYRYLATVISLVTSYDYDGVYGWQVATAYGSIMGGHSICQGYSRGFLLLCKKADLWCKTAEGVAGVNESHMWNLVKLDSGTYHVDVTWSDTQGLPGSPEWNRYFMLTQDEILLDHVPSDSTFATGETIAAP